MIDTAVPDSAEESMTEMEVQSAEESMTEIEVHSAEMGMTEAYCYTAGVYRIDTFGKYLKICLLFPERSDQSLVQILRNYYLRCYCLNKDQGKSSCFRIPYFQLLFYPEHTAALKHCLSVYKKQNFKDARM